MHSPLCYNKSRLFDQSLYQTTGYKRKEEEREKRNEKLIIITTTIHHSGSIIVLFAERYTDMSADYQIKATI